MFKSELLITLLGVKIMRWLLIHNGDWNRHHTVTNPSLACPQHTKAVLSKKLVDLLQLEVYVGR